MDSVRIDKILAKSGFGSRAEVKKLLKYGRVKCDGVTVRASGEKCDPGKVTVDGAPVSFSEFIYIMMNKPQGVISATEDNKKSTVIDLLDKKYANFQPFPVGRLDIDTEGLLLITNDGELAHNALSPKKHVDKTYFAQLLSQLSEEDRQKIEQGVDIGGYVTMPSEIKFTDGGVLITVREGKFHQVKKMFEAVGNKVTYLKRVKFGKLVLPENLKPGEYIEIVREEIL